MGLGDQNDPTKAAGKNYKGDRSSIQDPPMGHRCGRCRESGILPVAYVTTEGVPAIGYSCCNCKWGSYYYEVFSAQGMSPMYYDNWPVENADNTLTEYHDICAAAKKRYQGFRRAKGMPYRDERGAWIDERMKTKTTEDSVEYHDEDQIPDN